jgi:hypothetical protein
MDMDMDTGFFSWIISADISVPENFMDMDMDMPNFHGSYPWRALQVTYKSQGFGFDMG